MVRGAIASGCALVATALALTPAPAAADDNLGTTGGLTYVSGTNPFGPGAITIRSATCLAEYGHLIGGAFDSDNSMENGYLLESLPTDAGDSDPRPDDSWLIRAQNLAGASSMTSYAICGSDPTRYPSASSKLGPNKMKTLSVKCPTKTRVTNGGLSAEGSNDVLVSDLYPIDDGDKGKAPDDGWKARALNLDNAEEKITVHAICVKGVKTSYSGFNAPLAASSTLSVSPAPCPSNGFVTGGGARVTPVDARITAAFPHDTVADGDAVPDDRLVVEARNPSIADAGRFKVTFICLLRP